MTAAFVPSRPVPPRPVSLRQTDRAFPSRLPPTDRQTDRQAPGVLPPSVRIRPRWSVSQVVYHRGSGNGRVYKPERLLDGAVTQKVGYENRPTVNSSVSIQLIPSILALTFLSTELLAPQILTLSIRCAVVTWHNNG